ncbi:glutathione hydrolase 1 proenzyme [Trichonephila inaurata madagascariensis]|uniref:Glutathione hydrolase 1 proenzyme n=1 Tax=Trichonephila inaurata madagascariensis TaxID=2747483 RepID=A0A8X6X9J0_9ARAC|nr:glutathione hydrolase 1 proenzyme [Trichonephila inaurata madagascariensis]
MAAALGALYFALTLFLLTVAVSGACISLARLRNKYWFPEYQSESELGRFRNAAISTDAVPCATVGRDILAKKGSAADAAIAVLLCIGVINPQSSGIGGGFLMLYYNRAEKTAYYIDAREVAPEEATEDMFHGNASLARMGGLAIAVPGEVAGYEHIHDRFGSLPWKELFLPAIKMCREGMEVNTHLAKALKAKQSFIMEYKGIRNVFTNNETNKIYEKGDKYTRMDLAATLEAIAEEKSAAFYGPSETATNLLKDLKKAGSIITESDMKKYSSRDREPISKIFKNNMTLYSASLPGSGALLAFILGVLDGYEDFNAEVWRRRGDTVKTLHRIIEIFKFAYGQRMELEDSDSNDMKQTLIRTLWLNEDIKKAIDAPRFHHQLRPNVIEYEKFFPGDLIDDLKEKGHKLKSSSDSGIIMGILKDKGILWANSDYRKGGGVDGF